ncbi:MAG: hypothetical protein KJ574_03750 [Nanoarchaeota archaeon]|nr:hypothetical protein [Nanoarchaeota archaeon]
MASEFTLGMKELDPFIFQQGLFSPVARGADILAPVVIRATDIQGYRAEQAFHSEDFPQLNETLPEGLQTLQEACELPKKAVSVWATYAAFGGIAQYSARHNCFVGLLGRTVTHFRYATLEEAQHDFKWFGEQVMGDEWDELPEDERKKAEDEMRPYILCFGTKFQHRGPPRLDKTVVASKVFHSPLADNLADLVREVDSLVEDGDMTSREECHLFLVENGHIRYVAFKDPAIVGQMKDYGIVKIDGKSMWREFTDHDPMDMSELIVDEQ